MASFPLEYPSDPRGRGGATGCRTKQVVVHRLVVIDGRRQRVVERRVVIRAARGAPRNVVLGIRGSPHRVVHVAARAPDHIQSGDRAGPPDDVVFAHSGGAPDRAGAVGAPAVGAPHDVVFVVGHRAPDDVVF